MLHSYEETLEIGTVSYRMPRIFKSHDKYKFIKINPESINKCCLKKY